MLIIRAETSQKDVANGAPTAPPEAVRAPPPSSLSSIRCASAAEAAAGTASGGSGTDTVSPGEAAISASSPSGPGIPALPAQGSPSGSARALSRGSRSIARTTSCLGRSSFSSVAACAVNGKLT
eukprot:1176311-Prorocentrum_minimum.AAC.1